MSASYFLNPYRGAIQFIKSREKSTMTMPSKFYFQLLPILLLLIAAASHLIMGAEQEQLQPITLAGCPDKCGDISIPFPFGMKHGCFRPSFQIACDYSFRPPRAFLAYNGEIFQTMTRRVSGGGKSILGRKKDVELMDISVAKSEARVYAAVTSRCSTNHTHFLAKLALTHLGKKGPFFVSAIQNVLIGVGSSVEARMVGTFGETGKTAAYRPTCLSELMGNLQFATNGSCSGQDCCFATLPLEAPPLTKFGVGFKPRPRNPMSSMETNPCSYGMVVESSWYNFSTPDLYGYEVLANRLSRGVPVVLDFAIWNNGASSCPAEGRKPPVDYACVSGNSSCSNAAGGYFCECWDHYHGNPYITNG